MADPIRPNLLRPVQNFAAREASGQPHPKPAMYSATYSQDKQLPQSPRVYESATSPRDLKTHNITTRAFSSQPGYLKSHTGIHSGQSSARASSQQTSLPQNLPGTIGQPTFSITVEDLFKHPSAANPTYSSDTPRQPSVNSRQDSHSSSSRTESNTSSRKSSAASGQTDPDGLRTILQKATISGSELPTRSRPSEPGGFENRMQEIEQRMSQKRRAEWKAKREADRKELLLGINQPFKKNLEPFWKRSSATMSTQPSTLSSERCLPENWPGFQSRTIRSTYKVLHTPENIASTLETLVDELIECARIDVSEGLEYLRAALEGAYNNLSWGATSKWIANQALHSSRISLDTLARQYQTDNVVGLTNADIPEFKKKVKKCVHKFMEATKKIKPDREKLVTFEIDISMSSGGESRRTHRT
ncbi:hypothetical protein [Endozoicomonas sp. YOMI1]|uniref:hypothetical protein n=1 Tax=Endozoicomonas sp. YOMI1 TaxID=2828739 RepID=UPI002147F9DE|nr:hypothetical protein [Endozoicomonas sp. YOMI1]